MSSDVECITMFLLATTIFPFENCPFISLTLSLFGDSYSLYLLCIVLCKFCTFTLYLKAKSLFHSVWSGDKIFGYVKTSILQSPIFRAIMLLEFLEKSCPNANTLKSMSYVFL